MIDSRLVEFHLDEKRRQPMTPAQMMYFYGGIQEQPRKKSRFLANLGQALMSVGRLLRIKQLHYSEKAQS